MKHLTFVIPYYDNPGMLAHQYGLWRKYKDEQKERVDIVLVDDGSPNAPAIDVPRPAGLPVLSIYRVKEDKPWHQHGARNLGAYVAQGPWLFMTDMDHVMPRKSLKRLLKEQDEAIVYTFPRVDAPDLTPTLGRDGQHKPHPNTFALHRNLYWRVGGYDEDYCGIYGTDGMFRSRLFAAAGVRHLRRAPIIRYPREVIGDASTRTLARKEGRDPDAKRRVADRKRVEGRESSVSTLQFEWERVL